MTVFFPHNGSHGAVLQQPEAQLTCLKAVGESDAANATASPTDANTPSPATGLSVNGLLLLGLALLGSMAMVV